MRACATAVPCALSSPLGSQQQATPAPTPLSFCGSPQCLVEGTPYTLRLLTLNAITTAQVLSSGYETTLWHPPNSEHSLFLPSSASIPSFFSLRLSFVPLPAAASPAPPLAAPITRKKPRFAVHSITSTFTCAGLHAVRVWRVFWPVHAFVPYSGQQLAQCYHRLFSFHAGLPLPAAPQLLAATRAQRSSLPSSFTGKYKTTLFGNCAKTTI